MAVGSLGRMAVGYYLGFGLDGCCWFLGWDVLRPGFMSGNNLKVSISLSISHLPRIWRVRVLPFCPTACT